MICDKNYIEHKYSKDPNPNNKLKITVYTHIIYSNNLLCTF